MPTFLIVGFIVYYFTFMGLVVLKWYDPNKDALPLLAASMAAPLLFLVSVVVLSIFGLWLYQITLLILLALGVL